VSRLTIHLFLAVLILIALLFKLAEENGRNDPNFGRDLALTLLVVGLGIAGIIMRNKDAE
jgi:hypothetical protein